MTMPLDMPMPGWRGYLNKITYGAPLSAPADDAQVIQIAEDLIAGQLFEEPVEKFYQAAMDGLRSDEDLRWSDDQDERVVRDFFSRLVRALDDRRPWPEPMFRSLPVDRWLNLQHAPIIGRIPEYPTRIQTQLRRHFSVYDSDSPDSQAIILLLRTGQTVGLRISSWLDPNIDVYSEADPEATRVALRQLIGLDVQPI